MAQSIHGHDTRYHLSSVFKISNRTICLVCMETDGFNADIVEQEHNILTHENNIKIHFLSDGHKRNERSLFEGCFTNVVDIKQEKYADIISSLVLDTSLYLGNDPTYVTVIGFHVVCLMCSEKLFETCIEESSMDIILYDHLKSKQHVKNRKIWTCWIYFFKDQPGFLMISESKVYCSFCKITMAISNNFPFTVLENHLHEKHIYAEKSVCELEVSKGLNSNLDDQCDISSMIADALVIDAHQPQRISECAKDHCELEKGFDQYSHGSNLDTKEDFMKDKLNYYLVGYPETTICNTSYSDDNNSQPLESVESFKESAVEDGIAQDCSVRPEDAIDTGNQVKTSDSCPRGMVEHRETISVDSVDGSVISSFETSREVFNVFSNSSSVMENNHGPDFDSELSDSDEYYDTLETLTCPICGSFVEVINENAEFSLDLHCQKHKALDLVNTDREIKFDANVEYACPICHDVIPVFNKNIELSVQLHFEERKIDHEGFGCGKLTADCVAFTFDNFPEPLKKYQRFIVMEKDGLFCNLCNCSVSVGGVEQSNTSITKEVQDHLSNAFHEEQYRSLSQDLTNVVLGYNIKYQNEQPDESIYEILVKRHPLLRVNRKFISKKGVHYFCELCQKYINHASNEPTLVLNFMLHLRGPKHKKAFKDAGGEADETFVRRKRKEELELHSKMRKEMMETMETIADKSDEVYMNQSYFNARGALNGFYCKICKELVKFSRSGSELISHCKSFAHNDLLTKNASTIVANLHQTNNVGLGQRNHTKKLKEILKFMDNWEFLKPHTQLIITDGSECRCVMCSNKMPLNNKDIEKHIFSCRHKDRCFQVHLGMNKKNKPPKVKVSKELQAKKVLAKLLEYYDSVAKNSQFIGVKNDSFFCNVCCETMQYSSKGKHLIAHLNSYNHQQMVKRITNV